MSLNIAPHIPQVVVNSAAPTTESLTRTNAIKEVVPAAVKVEANVPQKSREQDTRAPVADDVTYQKNLPQGERVIPEDPQSQDERGQQGQQQNSSDSDESSSGSDNNDTSQNDVGQEGSGAGSIAQEQSDNSAAAQETDGENEQSDSERSEKRSEERAEREQQRQEQQEIQQLSSRDTEVRNHEMAHAAVGGSYAGAPSYEYQTGPDGKKYAVGGEVSIDVSKAATPEETIEKMQTVRAAALAPAEPSSQDRKVAAEASQNIAEARVEMIQQAEKERQDIAASVRETFADSNRDSENGQTSNSFSENVSSSATEGLQASSDNVKRQRLPDAITRTAEIIEKRYKTSYVEENKQLNAFTAVA